jgi:hypothetical protein
MLNEIEAQCPAQLVDVIAESRHADCLSQEVAAQRVPASGVERLEERPRGRGKRPALAPGEKLSPLPTTAFACGTRRRQKSSMPD